MATTNTTENAAPATVPAFPQSWENKKKTLIPVGIRNGLLSADDCMSWAFEAHQYAVSHFKHVIGKNGAPVEFDAFFCTCYSSLLLRNTDPSTRFGNISLGTNDNEDAPAFDVADDQPDVGDDPDIEGWRMADCEMLIEKSRHYGSEINALARFFCDGGDVAGYAQLHGITERTVERIIHEFNKKVFEKPCVAVSFGQGSLFDDADMEVAA